MANRQLTQLDSVATSAVTSSAAFVIQDVTLSDPNTRQLSLAQVSALVVADQKIVRALTSSAGIANSSASVTGTSSINTGLTTLMNVALTIRGALSSSAAAVSWSALASSGWFQARVYANPVSSSEAPALSTIAQTVDWIAVGTI